MTDFWRCKNFSFILVFLLLFGCKKPKGEQVKQMAFGEALGTSYQITFIAQPDLRLEQSIDSVFQVINQSMSTYLPDSDISQINRGNTNVVVDDMFEDVFKLSAKVYKETEGYFDPTVGVLVNAWGFGPGNQIEMDSTRVDSLLTYVGFDKVHLTRKNTIEKKYPEIYFDFNAVAKGYSIDRLAEMLDQLDLENYLIEVGGEIRSKGMNIITHKPWMVGVDNPQAIDDRRTPKIVLSLENAAMASSGNYRKFRVNPDTKVKYVHTIDPKTGFTKNSNVLATSVIASTCAEADAFATAFMAMDLDKSIALLERQKKLDAYIIYIDAKGETKEYMTPGFEKRVRK